MSQKIIRLRLRNKKARLIEIVVTEVGTRSKYKIYDKVGYIHKHGLKERCCVNFMRLAYWLNRGVILKQSVKKYLGEPALAFIKQS